MKGVSYDLHFSKTPKFNANEVKSSHRRLQFGESTEKVVEKFKEIISFLHKFLQSRDTTVEPELRCL